MNIEMSNHSLIKVWLNACCIGGKIIGAARAALRKHGQTSSCNRTKILNEAREKREQRQAEAMAQLQQVRFFR